MIIDGILLNKQIRQLRHYLPCKIQKISQISDYELLFNCRNKEMGKFNLFISLHPNTAHFSIVDTKMDALEEPKGFLMLLRKHLEQSVITQVNQPNYDRWFTLDIKTFNSLGDAITIQLVIELMGKYANCILVNEQGIILDAIKRIPPFQNQLRTIQPGSKFIPTPMQENKKDPFKERQYDINIPLSMQYLGFGKELSCEISYRLNQGNDFYQLMKEIEQSESLYVTCINQQYYAHCIELTYLNHSSIPYDFFNGINTIYTSQENQERLKVLTSDVVKCIKNNFKHYKGKLTKLNDSLDQANDCEIYRQYGDSIFTTNNQKAGFETITCYDFTEEMEVLIPLDPRYDSYTNARKYYKKYNKGKKSIEHIEKQINICKKEFDYFSELKDQLEYMDVLAATQIRQQLINKGFLRNKQVKHPKRNKDKTILTNSIEVNGTRIYYGKNSLQNEQITFNTNARKGLWFHVKDSSGSHVLLTDHFEDEFYIRLCAQIAALFSPSRNSSSVEVQYCPVHKIKKLPKGNPGQVLIANYKSIFIDPDMSLMSQYNL